MSNIPLRDILINARQESFRMRHFYLGAEHLFIALLAIQNGLASGILEDYGFTADYVIDAVRRKIGKGGKHRLWAGLPNTPRADVILSIANDLALEDGREEINERDLLSALFEERDNLPVRVLSGLGLDLDALAMEARARKFSAGAAHAYVRVDFGQDYVAAREVDEDHLFVLRRMFFGYSRIRVEHQLMGGYSEALLLVVTPVQADSIEDASVVVKIDRADIILDEAQRYENHVKNTLPPLTARIEDKVTAPETSELAGIKYTFVAGADGVPRDLRAAARDWDTVKTGAWLRETLYPSFGRTWWRQRRPFRFQVWAEYDWMLPPLLTLELVEGEDPPPDTPVLRDPIRRAKMDSLEYGDLVVLENFTVQRVQPERHSIRLAIGRGTEAAKRAFKIDVNEVDLTHTTYYRGEVVERLVGRVFKTREEALVHTVSALEPDFDPRAEFIPGVRGVEKMPNPIIAYKEILDRHVNGALSKIHGDLHLGNILVGPGENPFLIDFAHTRDGHTLADWATLEVSLLSDLVMPAGEGESWNHAYGILAHLVALQGHVMTAKLEQFTVIDAMSAVRAVRLIAEDCLAIENGWVEYYVALGFCALRAILWETMSLGSRRLMFLVSALAFYELKRRTQASGSMDTSPDADLTDSSA